MTPAGLAATGFIFNGWPSGRAEAYLQILEFQFFPCIPTITLLQYMGVDVEVALSDSRVGANSLVAVHEIASIRWAAGQVEPA